jgi:hypothetical protein
LSLCISTPYVSGSGSVPFAKMMLTTASRNASLKTENKLSFSPRSIPVCSFDIFLRLTAFTTLMSHTDNVQSTVTHSSSLHPHPPLSPHDHITSPRHRRACSITDVLNVPYRFSCSRRICSQWNKYISERGCMYASGGNDGAVVDTSRLHLAVVSRQSSVSFRRQHDNIPPGCPHQLG